MILAIRTVRLFRLFKLTRFWGKFNNILIALTKTIKEF